jgi:hypothetical protein
MMNKRQRKKREGQNLKKFIYNVSIEYTDLRDDFYYEAWNEIDDEETDACFCDECIPNFKMAIHKAAWNDYKEMMKEGRDFTRIINLGRRKIEIGLYTDGSGRSDWSFGCVGVSGKAAVFNALTEEEKKIVIMHPHFHKY